MVERGSLENCWRRKALVGSNPTPSALQSAIRHELRLRLSTSLKARGQGGLTKVSEGLFLPPFRSPTFPE